MHKIYLITRLSPFANLVVWPNMQDSCLCLAEVVLVCRYLTSGRTMQPGTVLLVIRSQLSQSWQLFRCCSVKYTCGANWIFSLLEDH